MTAGPAPAAQHPTDGPLDAAKVREHIADAEREIEALQQIADTLQRVADEAHENLAAKEIQLRNFRQWVERCGTVEPAEQQP